MADQEVTATTSLDFKTTKAFFTSPLDSSAQRNVIQEKVHEWIVQDNGCSRHKLVYLGPAGWNSFGEVSSPTSQVMALCRRYGLLPSERSILLPLHEQYQAIQLCLARINKKKHGEFMAAASDVLDIWNHLYHEMLNFVPKTTNEDDDDIDFVVPSSRRHSCDPVAEEMSEAAQSYREFLENSSCMDHFKVYTLLKENLQNEQLVQDICSKVFIIEGVSQMPVMERELLQLLLSNAEIYCLSAAYPLLMDSSVCSELNMSGIGEDDNILASSQASNKPEALEEAQSLDSPHGLGTKIDKPNQEDVSIEIEKVNKNVSEYLDSVPKSPYKNNNGNDSELYVEQLLLAHLRLMINTRDELALTVTCSMPGREISQQGFADIKSEAQKKNMPMYQTILSFIMRLRLGGKGYQADPDCPVLCHAKPLGEFVDSLMKLQNIVEEERDPKKGASRVLAMIKGGLLRMRGCVLKGATIEKVFGRLNSSLNRLMAESTHGERMEKPPAQQQTTAALRPCLKFLVKLCDEASGHLSPVGIVDALGENFLTQCSSSRKSNTPIRIPTVLSLFRSPGENSPGADADSSLRVRLMKKQGLTPPVTILTTKRHQSDCAWAPEGLSPVNKGNLSKDKMVDMSPIIGPTLKAVGKGRKVSQNWREIVESVVRTQEEEKAMAIVEVQSKASKEKKSDEKPAKRSLLSDIANISHEPSTKKGKNETNNIKPKKSTKVKPIPKGQRSITSFFKI